MISFKSCYMNLMMCNFSKIISFFNFWLNFIFISIVCSFLVNITSCLIHRTKDIQNSLSKSSMTHNFLYLPNLVIMTYIVSLESLKVVAISLCTFSPWYYLKAGYLIFIWTVYGIAAKTCTFYSKNMHILW